MSTVRYKRNPTICHYVLYSYESQGELKSGIRATYAQSESEAIIDANANLLVSRYDSYNAIVIGSRTWS